MTEIRVRVDWDDNQFLSLQNSGSEAITPLIDPAKNLNNKCQPVYIHTFEDTYMNNSYPSGEYFDNSTQVNEFLGEVTYQNILSPEVDELGLWKVDVNMRLATASNVASYSVTTPNLTFPNIPVLTDLGNPVPQRLVYWVRYKPGTTPFSTNFYANWASNISNTTTFFPDHLTVLTDEWQRVEINFTTTGYTSSQLRFYVLDPADNPSARTHVQIKGLQLGKQSDAWELTNTVFSSDIAEYENVSDDVLSCEWSLGVTENTQAVAAMPKRIADEGVATIELDNTSGLYSPDDTTSPLSTYLTPGKRVLIEMKNDQTEEFQTVWTGYIRSLKPEISSGSAQSVVIEASQGWFNMEDAIVPSKTLTSQTSDLSIKELVNNAPFVSPVNVSLFRVGIGNYITERLGTLDNYLGDFDTGDTTLDEIVVDGETSLLDIVNKIMQDEQGLFWINHEGKLNFSKRTAYDTPTVADSLTVDVDTNEAEYEYRYEQPNAIQVLYSETQEGTAYPGNRYWYKKPSFTGHDSANTVQFPYDDLEVEYQTGILTDDKSEFSIALPTTYTDNEGKTWDVTWEQKRFVFIPTEDLDYRLTHPSSGFLFDEPGFATPEDDDGTLFGRNVGLVHNGSTYLDINTYTASDAAGAAFQDFPVRVVINVVSSTANGEVINTSGSTITFYLTSFPWNYTLNRDAVYEVFDNDTLALVKSQNTAQVTLNYVSDSVEAESIGDDLLNQLKDPEGMFRSITLQERPLDPIWQERMLSYHIGDVLSLTDTVSGVTNKNHLIIREIGSWRDNDFTMTFGLRRV